MINRLKTTQIPVVRAAILKSQQMKCAVCEITITNSGCLDHDHHTGLLRGVLCNNCNGIEGKIKNLVIRGRRWHEPKNYLGKMLLYWIKHETDQTGLYHPIHKTDDEKRELRNARARKTRAKAKKG